MAACDSHGIFASTSWPRLPDWLILYYSVLKTEQKAWGRKQEGQFTFSRNSDWKMKT